MHASALRIAGRRALCPGTRCGNPKGKEPWEHPKTQRRVSHVESRSGVSLNKCMDPHLSVDSIPGSYLQQLTGGTVVS